MTRSLRSGAVLLALAAAAAVVAAPAQAACGGVATAQPKKRLGPFAAPLVVGDSVLLGAIREVARQGFEIDTRGCRAWSEGTRVVLARKRRGRLPHEVVMFLGADWTVSVREIRKVMAIVGRRRVLVLVTPRELGGRGGPDAAHMRRVARRFPRRVLLLDWVRHTRGRPGWFAPDGIHLSYGGAAGLARFLRRALPYAAPGRFPGPPRRRPDPEPQPAPADPQPAPGEPQPAPGEPQPAATEPQPAPADPQPATGA